MASEAAASFPLWRRWLTFALLVTAAVLTYAFVPGFQRGINEVAGSLLMGDVRSLKYYILSFGWWAPAVSVLLMLLQTLVAPLPAFVLAIANAMAFGLFYGFLLTASSAMLAAYLAFYITRWLGRPFIEKKMKGSAVKVDSCIESYGAWGILVLRLFPIVSFDFVSFAAGLTGMRARSFGLATFFGMLPATIAFTLLGDSVEKANRWGLIGGGVLLGVLLLAALCMRRTAIWKRMGAAAAPSPKSDVTIR
ncbi:MAG: TVP38/TMEM64 family protein [bacterium]|nr:TVP38/TMEM64 family protein [bacterium]